MDPRETIGRFRDGAVAALGGRLECLVLTGSHARGDARPGSDVDFWLFVRDLAPADLDAVGEVVAGLGRDPEINPQCTTFAEMRHPAFAAQFNPVQLHLDGEVLHGRLDLPAPTDGEILAAAAGLAAQVLMSARHYLTVREPEAALHAGKLRIWVLKPLMWALRYEALVRTGTYPRGLAELAASVPEPARRLVDLHRAALAGGLSGEIRPVLAMAAGVAETLLAAGRPAGEPG